MAARKVKRDRWFWFDVGLFAFICIGLFVLFISAALRLGAERDESLNHRQAQAKGEELYNKHGCISCHGENGDAPSVFSYPRLSSQSSAYLYEQMVDIQSGKRANGKSALMRAAISQVPENDLELIAEFLGEEGGTYVK